MSKKRWEAKRVSQAKLVSFGLAAEDEAFAKAQTLSRGRSAAMALLTISTWCVSLTLTVGVRE